MQTLLSLLRCHVRQWIARRRVGLSVGPQLTLDRLFQTFPGSIAFEDVVMPVAYSVRFTSFHPLYNLPLSLRPYFLNFFP